MPCFARIGNLYRRFRWIAVVAWTAGCAGSGALGPQGPLSSGCDQPSCCPAGLQVRAGTDGDDRLHGRSKADCLVGKAGEDSVKGRCGKDFLFCGQGDDRCSGGSGADVLLGGEGADRVRGRWGRDDVRGDTGEDEVFGGFGTDELRGGRGDDRLTGGPGADLIRPGPDRDQAFGRGSSDVFVIGAACEAKAGETVDGGPGFDRVRSPLTRAQLEARGVSFVSIESFEIIPPLFDECADVKKAWGETPVQPPGGGDFVEASPRPGGGWLAATDSRVFSVSAEGALAPVASGERAVSNPGGDTFGLYQGGGFRVFDAAGAPLGTFPGVEPFQYFKLIPGGNLVFAPRVRVTQETGTVESVRILRPDGSVVADFLAPGLEISRLSPDRIVYTQPSSLTARRLDGTVLWSAPRAVHKLESTGDRTLLVPRFVQGQVVHLSGAAEVASTAVDGTVWNLAMAPQGTYSAATTRTSLYVFQDGQPAAEVRLPVASANSLAVSDRGEILVGGQGPGGEGRILLYHFQGNLLWEGPAGLDRAGYRPAVHFAPGGDRFLVLERQGLTAYDIVRSPAP